MLYVLHLCSFYVYLFHFLIYDCMTEEKEFTRDMAMFLSSVQVFSNIIYEFH